MTVTLSPTWILSDAHATASYGQPVLINGETGEAYGPSDMVQLYPSHEPIIAKLAVMHLVRTLNLSAAERQAVSRFTQ